MLITLIDKLSEVSSFGRFPGAPILRAYVAENKTQTPGNRPKEGIQNSKQGERLKSRLSDVSRFATSGHKTLHRNVQLRVNGELPGPFEASLHIGTVVSARTANKVSLTTFIKRLACLLKAIKTRSDKL